MNLKVTLQSDAGEFERTLSALLEVAGELGDRGLEFLLGAREILDKPGCVHIHALAASGAREVRIKVSCPELEEVLRAATRARDLERDGLRGVRHDGASDE